MGPGFSLPMNSHHWFAHPVIETDGSEHPSVLIHLHEKVKLQRWSEDDEEYALLSHALCGKFAEKLMLRARNRSKCAECMRIYYDSVLVDTLP